VRVVPRLCELYTLAFASKLGKKNGKASVRMVAHTTKADTVQCKKNEQYNTQKKNSKTEYYNVTEQYRTLNMTICSAEMAMSVYMNKRCQNPEGCTKSELSFDTTIT
jgi:hypothetical protein